MTTPNMGMTEPVDHDTNDAWGAALNACLDTIDSHDHSPGKGAPVPSSGLKINADVPWSFSGTPRSITGARALTLTTSVAADVAAFVRALWSDGTDLFYKTGAGVNVQLTAGGSINVSLVGGIGGDYASVGALVDFTDASDQYAFRQQVGAAVRQFARMASADVDLYEYKANPAAGVPANRVRLKSPAALAGSYDVTWLAALPASTLAIQMSNAGVLTASNTFASALVAPDFKVSSSRIMPVNAASFALDGNTATKDAIGRIYVQPAAAGISSATIGLQVGDQITQVVFWINKVSNNTNTIQFSLRGLNMTSGATTFSDQQNYAGNATGFVTVTIGPLTRTIATGNTVQIGFSQTVGASFNDQIYGAEVTYVRP